MNFQETEQRRTARIIKLVIDQDDLFESLDDRIIDVFTEAGFLFVRSGISANVVSNVAVTEKGMSFYNNYKHLIKK